MAFDGGTTPDFATIYGTSAPAATQPDITTELASIGVTSLDGLTDAQLQDVASKLVVHRNQVSQQRVIARQAAANAAMPVYPETGQPATTTAADGTASVTGPGGLDPAAWLAYLQKVGPKGYGGDPQDYANAIYDAHYQVARAGGTTSTASAAAAAGAPAGASTLPKVSDRQGVIDRAKASGKAYDTASINKTMANNAARVDAMAKAAAPAPAAAAPAAAQNDMASIVSGATERVVAQKKAGTYVAVTPRTIAQKVMDQQAADAAARIRQPASTPTTTASSPLKPISTP